MARHPNDPWFLIALVLIPLLGIWLGIFGPLPEGVKAELQHWQTLIAACVALVASGIAWRSATRQLRQAEELEARRRSRKHAALRAVLPLALSAITEYAARSTEQLRQLLLLCGDDPQLPADIAVPTFGALSGDTIKAFSEFIEFADAVDVRLFEKMLERIQIQRARLDSLASDIARSDVITKHYVETLIIGSAEIYAGSAAAFDYARRRDKVLPPDITWDQVRRALRNMRLFENDIGSVFSTIDRLAENRQGPA